MLGVIGLLWLGVDIWLGVDSGTPAKAEPSAAVPACIHWLPIVRYRAYGYDHVVRLESKCDKPASCTVSTNVNPTPVSGTLPAGGRIELLTFNGSPARTFVPSILCTLR